MQSVSAVRQVQPISADWRGGRLACLQAMPLNHTLVRELCPQPTHKFSFYLNLSLVGMLCSCICK